jgi:hypothetical protein
MSSYFSKRLAEIVQRVHLRWQMDTLMEAA